MEFEWDEEKNRKNIEKHGISFMRAATIFNGPTISKEDKRKECNEIRIQAIGLMLGEVVIMLVHTDRLGITRIISARLASRKERKLYHACAKEKK